MSSNALALNPIQGYKPKTTSQLPGTFIATLTRGLESEEFKNLSEGPKALYMVMPYFVKWNHKQKTKSGSTYISGRTRLLKAQEIVDQFFPNREVSTINSWLKELIRAGLLVSRATEGNVRYFIITAYRSPSAIAEWEDNATKRDLTIAELAAEKETRRRDFAIVEPEPKSDISVDSGLLFNTETKETSSLAEAPGADETQPSRSSSSDAHNQQLDKAYEMWTFTHKNKKRLARAAFFKWVAVFVELCQEYWNLEAAAAYRVLISAISKMPSTDSEGKGIGSPLWLIKDDRNHHFMVDGLKAEGVEIEKEKLETSANQVSISAKETKYFEPEKTDSLPTASVRNSDFLAEIMRRYQTDKK